MKVGEMSDYGHVVLEAGHFPDEWWMRDLAGQLFAVVGRYSEPVTWKEAHLYTGYVWENTEPLYQQFELVQDPQSLGSWMEHAEKLVLPEQGGTLLYAYATSGSTVAWLNHTTSQWFDIWGHTFSTEGMRVRLKGGGHYMPPGQRLLMIK